MRRRRTMQASESANTGMQLNLNPGTEDANDDAVPAVADPANAIYVHGAPFRIDLTTTTNMTTTARTIITHTTTFTTIIHARHPRQNDNRQQISSNDQ